MKTDIQIKLILSFSKFIGAILIIAGIAGMFGKFSNELVLTCIISGSAMITGKQYFDKNKPKNSE